MSPQNASNHPRAKGRSAKVLVLLGLVPAVVAATAPVASAAEPPSGRGGAVPPPSNAQSTRDPAPSAGAPAVEPEAVRAFARQNGVTVDQARARLVQERELAGRGARIQGSLGGKSGGIYIDADGNLVVTALDQASSAAARRSGARPKIVDDSAARLEAIIKRLNDHAAKEGSGAVQGWHVDVKTNSVVVTVSTGANDSATGEITKLARSFGDSVRFEERPAAEAPKPTAFLVGGFSYRNSWNGGTCSVGFNTRDASNRNVVLTAGHCVTQQGSLSRNGYLIGTSRTANYPTDDFGTFSNQYPSFWQPSPSVFRYDGTYIRLAGQWNNPPVGATVCKSGATTRFTCGRITALNRTVNYGGRYIYGLAQHNACVEPGDSGGSNISAGRYALGVTSGASLISGKCLSKYGRANVSWYQPVGEALSRNGLRLVL